jgi:predicted aminopeptidase
MMRRIPRRSFRVPALVGLAAGLATACSPGYLLRAGLEQARLLERREPLEAVIADPATDAETRRRLELVGQARDFAAHHLGLEAGASYTTYARVESDTMLLVVSGARKDRFVPYTWHFPIVGQVPYKGFFDFQAAHREAAALEAAGYDADVRPAAAFSTLGWFNDPLLSTILRFGDVDLVNTVIHELLHNTIFLPGRVAFNESFATFVGDRGAILFFCEREGPDAERCTTAVDDWHDRRVFGRFLTSLVAELETLYRRTDLGFDEILAARERVFDATRARFAEEVVPGFRGRGYRGFATRPLNNATLIGIRLYYQRLDLFEAVFEALEGNLPATIHAVIEVVEGAHRYGGSPFEAVEHLLTTLRLR